MAQLLSKHGYRGVDKAGFGGVCGGQSCVAHGAPSVAGFVCSRDDPSWWRREVAAVWREYYAFVASNAFVPGACVACCTAQGSGVGTRSDTNLLGVGSKDGGGCCRRVVLGLHSAVERGADGVGVSFDCVGGAVHQRETPKCNNDDTGLPNGVGFSGGVHQELDDRGSVKADGGLAGGIDGLLGAAVGSVSATDASVGVCARGPNWARNQVWRREKKLKRQRRNAKKCGASERVDTSVGVSVVPGFFSECDEETRKQLRDSRANLLIAKNKRELAEVNRRVSQLDSSEMVVQDMLRLVKVSDALKKRTKDTRIGGWAATLVDTVVERSASSVPNSVPSLTEVGLSDSVSQNGKNDRKNEYERKRAAIETEFENMEYYAGFEYDNAVADLKREYMDALCGESELAERKLINRVYQEYSKMYMECTKGTVSADAVLDMIADIKREVEVEL